MVQNLLINYASHSGTGTDKFKSEFSVDNEVNFAIYRFPYPSFPGILLGIPFTMADAEYFTFYDNYIVFSNSLQGLESYLRSMILGATLNKDINYARFKQNCPGRSNINIFLDINKAFSIGGEIFDGELAEQLSERENNLRKYSKMSWQIQRNKDIYFNALAIAFDQNPREEAQTTWQSTIGSDIRIKPELVINHNDRLNREIILQDVTNTLHQVTNEGRIRWSIPLSGPVLSEIHQVDYYKNGRLQYLFNTKEKLFLIDRNGNNVAHFPVSLRSEATNGISVFDYNNNRDYRYFIAGEDKKIYVYDYEGKIVKGWIFGQTDHEVVTPVQHFRVAGKDYIVFKDKSRIYIQNRRGETRVSTKARFENSANPLVLSLEGTPKIVADDVKGKVYYIYFSGKYEEKKTSGFSKDHFFTVDDLDGNGIPDFIFVDGKELVVIDGNGKRRFREKFENSIHSPPNIYTFTNNHKKIGIVDADGNNIYLFNPDGTLNKGFPLQGNTEFSIGRISENSDGLNLLTGSEGGKLYNYTLD